MTKEKIKLIKDTIRDLIDVIDPPVTESSYVERLRKRKDAVEVGEILVAQLEKMI